jgi:hypothetical protein
MLPAPGMTPACPLTRRACPLRAPRSFKYVPYGQVAEVMPYLIRRAQENADVMSGATSELRMLRHEIWRRTLPFHKQAAPPPQHGGPAATAR